VPGGQRRPWTPARPDILPLRSGELAAALAPGRALAALRAELAACGIPVSGMTITRLHGTAFLPAGLVVRYCCGWLLWPTGRQSLRGRSLHCLHSARDPAGAARRLWRPAGEQDAPAGDREMP
jgi:hypothetical protein